MSINSWGKIIEKEKYSNNSRLTNVEYVNCCYDIV